MSADAALRYLRPVGAFEAGLLGIARAFVRPGSVVWDVGANVGAFSFASASLGASRVLAVEPDLWLASLIQRSARLRANRALWIDVLPAAASDVTGMASFLIAERGRASSALEEAGGRTQAGGCRERHPVPTVALDELMEVGGRPDLVKIDVEGAEALVLRGARRLLSDVRPVLYVEVGRDQNDEVSAMLRDAGYSFFAPLRPLGKRGPLKRCTRNTLACPAEQVEPLGLVETLARAA